MTELTERPVQASSKPYVILWQEAAGLRAEIKQDIAKVERAINRKQTKLESLQADLKAINATMEHYEERAMA